MTKISELTSIVTAAATDIIAVVQGGVTKRATVQDYRDAGIIPTADQAAALAAYEAALAAAEAGQVLTASGPGAAAFAPASGGTSLSDYQKVIVVDPDGNGDYTTLSDAVTNASSGDVIHVFGQHSENVFFDFAVPLTIFGYGASWTNVQPVSMSANLTVYGLFMNDVCIVPLGAASTLKMVDVAMVCTSQPGAIETDVSGMVFEFQNVTISGVDQALRINFGANVVLHIDDSRLYSSVSSVSTSVSTVNFGFGTTVSGWIRNTRVDNTGGGKSFYSAAVQSGLAFSNCNFIGPLRSNVAWSNAPFYHCRFNGTVTNITANSGTANGTNVVI